MTAKEYLRQYEYANRKAIRYKTEYETELEKIDTIRSPLGGDGMPHGNGISRKVEDDAIRLSEKASDWKKAEVAALNLRQEIFETIHDIPGIEGEILIERYLNLHRWEDICVLVHLSWRQTHRLHKKALTLVEKKMALNGTI